MTRRLLALGPDPQDLELRLVRRGSFAATFTRTASETDQTAVDFDPDGSIELTIGDSITWTGAITGPDATFSRTVAQVQAALDEVAGLKGVPVGLWYVKNADRVPWALGLLSVRG